ncbi:RidA family protein [Psychrobacter jeotgali]|uniref:RidA family protein n=1 Tax=Psychrobacter jeotgali TaxID=179010 RepID=UPI0019196D59|nr:RidA family protein [Psychrobacter jeotgali]
MSDTIIKASRNTDNAPKHSHSTQTVAFSHYNYISAQLPVRPTMDKVVANDVKAQATQCLKNIEAIAESIDHVMDDVVKINIYLKNIEDIDAIDLIYAGAFQSHLPTRTVIAVDDLPMEGALVQMDAIVSNGEGTHPQDATDLIKVESNTENAPKDSASMQTVAFSHYNNISAQLPLDPTTEAIVDGGVKEQTEQCLKNIQAILENIEVPVDDIVKTTIFLTKAMDIEAVDQAYSTFFQEANTAKTADYLFPARTIVIASELPMNASVQIDAVISHGNGTPPQAVEDRHNIVIKAHNTDSAPKHSLSTQTVAFSHYNHLSGQLPIDPKSGKIVSGDINEQTKQCLENIKTIIESTNHVMDDIVKVTIQLKDIKDIEAVNAIYKGYFDSDLPARTVIGVSAIPMDALIQIDAILSNAEGTPPAS